MSNELICLFDSGFTLIRVNHCWSKIFGIAEEIAPGLCFLDFVPEIQHRQIRIDLSVLGPERRTMSFKHAVGLQSHVTAWIDWKYRIILDEHNTILAYEAVGNLKD